MSESLSSKPFWNYWGKARPAEAGPDFHRLVYHSLDVAAVGSAFLKASPGLLDTCCARLHCSPSPFLSWASFFLALHDLGKFSNTFQLQRPDLVQRLQHRDVAAGSYAERHDTLGFWIWKEQVRAGVLDRLNMSGAHQDIAYWMRAVCGHHGMPPIEKGSAEFHFRPADEGAVGEFILAMAGLLLTDEARRIPELAGDAFEEVSQQLSWWFAGLAVLADWLGSNTSFFKYQTAPQRIEDYWKDACTKAVAALQQSGVQPVPIAPGKTLQDFFPYIVEASPLQAWAQQVALPFEPQIYLLEDVTGAGKTEAALLLAYRLMAQGLAQGFFIGLPTMATANAMYGRVAGVYQELFDGRASLTLGHGFKDLVDAFAASVLPADVSEHDVAQLDDTASARCTAWLADHNKRVLLAPGGVGTVDQALLAVLHSKHQSLRLLGLFNKVLIVDEVHACDAYMEGVLAELLRFHASMGGSVILLSATLPNRMKSRLLGAYAQGRQSHLTSVSLNSAYPLATRWCAGQSALYQADFPSRKNVSRSVSVRYLSDIEVLYQDIRAALAAGQCVGWIRNTVADAVAAYERLASDIDPEKIMLFHARFALADRLRTEEAMLRYFGSASGANERRGRLVIATQVA
ncbi:MAG: CRISPR-associated helicase Cas3', partial [Sphingomonadaceae bacterium]